MHIYVFFFLCVCCAVHTFWCEFPFQAIGHSFSMMVQHICQGHRGRFDGYSCFGLSSRGQKSWEITTTNGTKGIELQNVFNERSWGPVRADESSADYSNHLTNAGGVSLCALSLGCSRSIVPPPQLACFSVCLPVQRSSGRWIQWSTMSTKSLFSGRSRLCYMFLGWHRCWIWNLGWGRSAKPWILHPFKTGSGALQRQGLLSRLQEGAAVDPSSPVGVAPWPSDPVPSCTKF